MGTVKSAAGQPQANVRVEIRDQGRFVTAALTDAEGQFTARISTGAFELQTPGGSHLVRAWHPTAAPPHASHTLQINNYEVVRGQYLGANRPCDEEMVAFYDGVPLGANAMGGFQPVRPMLLGAGIVSSVVLPIALADDNPGTNLGTVFAGTGTNNNGGTGDLPPAS